MVLNKTVWIMSVIVFTWAILLFSYWKKVKIQTKFNLDLNDLYKKFGSLAVEGALIVKILNSTQYYTIFFSYHQRPNQY